MATITIGTLRALLTADTAQFESGMRKATTSTKAFTKAGPDVMKAAQGITMALRTMGVGLSVGVLVNFGRELLNTADHLVKVADRTGLTTTEVQKLEHIASQSGNTLDQLTGAVSRLQNNLATKNGGAVQAVKDLKLNFEELRKANPYDQMVQIAGALQRIEDPAARTALAIKLFGRAGAEILPTLIADFEKLGDAAPVMSERTVRSLEQAGDALETFGRQLKVVAAESLNFVMDQYTKVISAWSLRAAGMLDMVAGVMRRLGMDATATQKAADTFRSSVFQLAGGLRIAGKETRTTGTATFDLGEETKKTTKKVDDATKAYRDFINALGVQEIEDAAKAMQDLESAAAAYRQFQNQIGEQEIKDAEDAADAKTKAEKEWRDYQNMVGERQMEDDAERMKKQSAHWTEMVDGLKRTWSTLQDSIQGSFAQMLLRARTFKEAMGDIWNAIKGAAINAFAQIAMSWLTNLAKMAVSAGGGGGSMGGLGKLLGGAGSFLGGPWGIALAGGALLAKPIWGGLKSIGRGIGRLFGFGGGDKKPKGMAIGGFVPPGVTMPAILHGGTHGEVIPPVSQGGMGRAVSVSFNISTLDGRDMKRIVVEKVIPILNQALTLNDGGFRTHVMREVTP